MRVDTLSIRSIKNSLLLYIKNNKSSVLTVLFISVFVDVVLIQEDSDLLTFPVLAFYITAIRFYKLKSNVTFLFCLCLLLIMFISFLLSGTSLKTEKTAVLIILFTAIGIGQQWKEVNSRA